MANEADLRASLIINKGNLDHRSYPVAFTADVTGANGPTPGAINVTTAGVDIDLSELTTYGFCRIANLDGTNYFEWGIWDGVEFMPIGRVLAGEFYIIRLSPNLGLSFGVGTGTTDSGNTLRLKADTAAVKGVVEAFEA